MQGEAKLGNWAARRSLLLAVSLEVITPQSVESYVQIIDQWPTHLPVYLYFFYKGVIAEEFAKVEKDVQLASTYFQKARKFRGFENMAIFQ